MNEKLTEYGSFAENNGSNPDVIIDLIKKKIGRYENLEIGGGNPKIDDICIYDPNDSQVQYAARVGVSSYEHYGGGQDSALNISIIALTKNNGQLGRIDDEKAKEVLEYALKNIEDLVGNPIAKYAYRTLGHSARFTAEWAKFEKDIPEKIRQIRNSGDVYWTVNE